MTSLDLVSTKQLAEMTGLDIRTCRAHALGAGLHEYAGRRFERDPALTAIKAAADPRVTLGNAAAARGSVVLPGAAKLAEAKARSEAARAAKLERVNAKENGELYRKSSVKTAGADIIARARTLAMGRGARLAARLAAMDDEAAIRRLLDEDAAMFLRELSRLDDLHAEMIA